MIKQRLKDFFNIECSELVKYIFFKKTEFNLTVQ